MNSSRYLISISLLVLLVVVTKPALGESLDAHIHGVAELTIALEENTLEIEFHSPSANLIGFEHKASTAKEKQAVTQAETLLTSPKELFGFEGVSCHVTKVIVDVSGVVDAEREYHDHSENSNVKEHNNDHSEIKAYYRFTCEKAKNLTSVSIAIFNRFSRIERINAMWVTENGQGSEQLNPKKNTVFLRK